MLGCPDGNKPIPVATNNKRLSIQWNYGLHREKEFTLEVWTDASVYLPDKSDVAIFVRLTTPADKPFEINDAKLNVTVFRRADNKVVAEQEHKLGFKPIQSGTKTTEIHRTGKPSDQEIEFIAPENCFITYVDQRLELQRGEYTVVVGVQINDNITAKLPPMNIRMRYKFDRD
jgi:hypothetical protein